LTIDMAQDGAEAVAMVTQPGWPLVKTHVSGTVRLRIATFQRRRGMRAEAEALRAIIDAGLEAMGV
jgi:hypothetical protein